MKRNVEVVLESGKEEYLFDSLMRRKKGGRMVCLSYILAQKALDLAGSSKVFSYEAYQKGLEMMKLPYKFRYDELFVWQNLANALGRSVKVFRGREFVGEFCPV